MSAKEFPPEESGIVLETQGVDITVTRSAKLIYTSVVLFVYFMGGVLKGQEGVSFLDLLLITGSDMETGSLLLTCSGLGFMVGPLLLGFLYDRYNNTAIFCIFIVSSGTMTFVIPWCSHIVAMCLAFAFRSFLTSAVDIGVLVITVKLWKQDVNPYMQATQAMFALGGIVSPLVTAPFIAQTPSTSQNIYNNNNNNNSIGYTAGYNYSYFDEGNVSKPSTEKSINIFSSNNESCFGCGNRTIESFPETNVYIAYYIMGGAMIVSAIPVFILWITKAGEKLIRKQNLLTAQRKQLDPELQRMPSRLLPVAIVLAAVFFFAYGPVEKTSANFLVAFLVKHLNWSKLYASKGSFAFYVGFAVGRFVGIALALIVPTTTMLFLFMLALVVCFGIFIIAIEQSVTFIWACIILSGVAMSTIYASIYAWVDVNVTSVSGKMASAMQVMLALGAIASTPLMGYLFEKQTPLWYLYSSITCASICLITYSALYRLSSTSLRKQNLAIREEISFLDSKVGNKTGD